MNGMYLVETEPTLLLLLTMHKNKILNNIVIL